MKKTIFIFLFLIAMRPVYCQHTAQSIYLVGDAGEDTIPGKALLLLKEELLAHPNSAVIFLGDNVYPAGLVTESHASCMHLESQLQILKDYKGQIYFVPGNHDWDAQRRNGLQALACQQSYVEDYLKFHSAAANRSGYSFLPRNGLPGPETVMLNEQLRLIVLDTQWFLHYYKKNSTGSKKHTRELFYARFDSILSYASAHKEQVLVAAHHPLYTNGEHSRRLQPFRFLINYTPFQVFGLMGLNRLLTQDLSQPRYRKMRKQLLNSLGKYDNIVYASGHDHNLQCFKEGGKRYIVSGSGSKRSHLRKHKRFSPVFEDDQHTGFVKLEYDASGNVKTTIFRAGEQPLVVVGY